MDVVVAVVFSQVDQDSSGTTTLSGSTEAAVTDPSARRTLPLLQEIRAMSTKAPFSWQNSQIICRWLGEEEYSTYRIQQGITDLLSIAVAETRATELTPHPHTLRVTAVGLGVDRLLAALVASGSLGQEIRGVNLLNTAVRMWNLAFENHCRRMGTYSEAVVHLLPHVVGDKVQLHLGDVLHRPHHMRNS